MQRTWIFSNKKMKKLIFLIDIRPFIAYFRCIPVKCMEKSIRLAIFQDLVCAFMAPHSPTKATENSIFPETLHNDGI